MEILDVQDRGNRAGAEILRELALERSTDLELRYALLLAEATESGLRDGGAQFFALKRIAEDHPVLRRNLVSLIEHYGLEEPRTQ